MTIMMASPIVKKMMMKMMKTNAPAASKPMMFTGLASIVVVAPARVTLPPVIPLTSARAVAYRMVLEEIAVKNPLVGKILTSVSAAFCKPVVYTGKYLIARVAPLKPMMLPGRSIKIAIMNA